MLLYEKIMSQGHVWVARLNAAPTNSLASVWKIAVAGAAVLVAAWYVPPLVATGFAAAGSKLYAPDTVKVPAIGESNIAAVIAAARAGDPALADIATLIPEIGKPATLDGILSGKPDGFLVPLSAGAWAADKVVFKVVGEDIFLGAKVLAADQTTAIWLGAAHKIDGAWRVFSLYDSQGGLQQYQVSAPTTVGVRLNSIPRLAVAAGLARTATTEGE